MANPASPGIVNQPYPPVAGTALNFARAAASGASTASGGAPAASNNAPAGVYRFNAVGVPNALSVNPAYAGDFYSGRYTVNAVVPGGHVPDKGVPPTPIAGMSPNAQTGAPAAFKDAPAPRYAPVMMHGPNPVAQKQPYLKWPWNKKFIPPLALFNDASQWVNALFFVRAMTRQGADTSNPMLLAQYFTPPPINTNNLAAGTLNLQLQLGMLAIQGQQLTIDASNYFGGS